jgi:CRISPR/Cas system-associated exonuclease Cas4 (RecB family)
MNPAPYTNGKSGHARYVPELPAPRETPAPAPETAPEAAAAPVRVLSPSQVNTYLECPAKWYFERVLDMPRPVSSSLCVGRAVDDAISAAMRRKARREPDLASQDLRDAYDLTWADQAPEATFTADESPDALRETGWRCVEAWMRDMAPRVEPAVIDGEPAVQVPVSGEIAGVPVKGYVDLITEDGTVIDLKTKRDRPRGIPSDHMLQITTYSQLSPHARGTAAIHYMVKGRAATSTVKCVPFTREITPGHVQYVESIYPAVAEAMHDGLYLPNRTSRLCSRRMCSYWEACQREYGGEVDE